MHVRSLIRASLSAGHHTIYQGPPKVLIKSCRCARSYEPVHYVFLDTFSFELPIYMYYVLRCIPLILVKQIILLSLNTSKTAGYMANSVHRNWTTQNLIWVYTAHAQLYQY